MYTVAETLQLPDSAAVPTHDSMHSGKSQRLDIAIHFKFESMRLSVMLLPLFQADVRTICEPALYDMTCCVKLPENELARVRAPMPRVTTSLLPNLT
jgi:hypothetical protein